MNPGAAASFPNALPHPIGFFGSLFFLLWAAAAGLALAVRPDVHTPRSRPVPAAVG